MSKKILDELQTKLGQIMESSPAKDIERNIRATLTQAISRLDIVTKEEFEIQRLIIARLQEKVDTLEARISALEASGSKDSPAPAESDSGQ